MEDLKKPKYGWDNFTQCTSITTNQAGCQFLSHVIVLCDFHGSFCFKSKSKTSGFFSYIGLPQDPKGDLINFKATYKQF